MLISFFYTLSRGLTNYLAVLDHSTYTTQFYPLSTYMYLTLLYSTLLWLYAILVGSTRPYYTYSPHNNDPDFTMSLLIPHYPTLCNGSTYQQHCRNIHDTTAMRRVRERGHNRRHNIVQDNSPNCLTT